ncbi:hypothetical protein V1512DRAFT_260621 [Lipomyces arxii]|uniref:uncharacterized protein n=1 Tax=Lipomyces arxii TaxID=56418 RepID=UPI0034CF3B62
MMPITFASPSNRSRVNENRSILNRIQTPNTMHVTSFHRGQKPPRYYSSSPELSVKEVLPFRRSSQPRPIEFNLVIESSPLVCYGPRTDSTGALLSGLLFLLVNAYSVPMSSVTLELIQEKTVRRPTIGACKDCAHRVTVLKRWDLLKYQTSLTRSEYGYPFSHLIPGDSPATTNSSLVNVSYYLRAVATPKVNDVAPIITTRPLSVFRSLISTDVRRCLRVFPPTNLSVSASLPASCYPKSTFTVGVQLTGIVNKERRSRWQLRKFIWRLDEVARLKGTGCSKHGNVGHTLEDVKTLSNGELKRGWKTDLANDGTVEFEAEISTFSELPIACNVSVPDMDFEIEHILVAEMLVAEEFQPASGPSSSTPTGAARILRMQFNIDITERGGLGISWDDEVPPTYADVPTSPPGYELLVPNGDVEHLVM